MLMPNICPASLRDLLLLVDAAADRMAAPAAASVEAWEQLNRKRGQIGT
jgi:hypothetical protein